MSHIRYTILATQSAHTRKVLPLINILFIFELTFANFKTTPRPLISPYHPRLITMEDCTTLLAALSLNEPATVPGSSDTLEALPAEVKIMILRHLNQESALALFAVSRTYLHTFDRYRQEIEVRLMINTLRARNVDMCALRSFPQTWMHISLTVPIPPTASETFFKNMKAAVKEYHDQLLLNTPMRLDSKHCRILSMITEATSLLYGPRRSRFLRGSSTDLILNMDDCPID